MRGEDLFQINDLLLHVSCTVASKLNLRRYNFRCSVLGLLTELESVVAHQHSFIIFQLVVELHLGEVGFIEFFLADD